MSEPSPLRLKRKLAGLAVFARWLGLRFSKRSFLQKAGWFDSVRYRAPCRPDGSPLPWMNYAMIAFLDERLKRDMSVFEYGSGNSTLYLASRVRDVVSVETDKMWHDLVARHLPDNVKLILCDPYTPEKYLATIAGQQRQFDIVIVDAENRGPCLRDAPRWLTPGGVALLDDADAKTYADDMAAIMQQGFRRIIFEGLKPGGLREYRTAVFYRDGNVFGL